jgi:predicted aminopeptidase
MRLRWPRRRAARWGVAGVLSVVALPLGVVATLCATSGCTSVDYLAQSATGHLSLLHAARPVKDAIADPLIPEPLRMRLQLTQRMRDFAVSELKLPDNASYRSYADLKRSAAVWCVGYRGYYDKASAEAAAQPLRAQGLDVGVYPVPAYSTLGWMNWLGGDPLLSTFVQWPEGELAQLMFHELAHQVAYAAGDTTFNESFATAVERLGSQRWMEANATADVRAQQTAIEARRQDFRHLVRSYRDRLDAVYKSELPDADKRARKAELVAALRADHETMKRERWNGFKGYDAWFAGVNNAALGAQAAYDDKVETFERLFAAQGSDFTRFYAEVQRLAKLPKDERDAVLARYQPAPPVSG